MSDTVFDIKCPRCSARAAAHMRRGKIKGTYREVTCEMDVNRIVCESCGFFEDVPPNVSAKYELWYATAFRTHRLWARNRKHLNFLIAWLAGDRSQKELHWADRAMVECFPKWMILAKNRDAILACLRKVECK